MSTEDVIYSALEFATFDSPREPARHSDSSNAPSAFDNWLGGLFHASMEARKPPEALRAMLACEYWQALATPEPGLLVAGLERTRAYVSDPNAQASKKKKKHLHPAQRPNSQNVAAFLLCTHAIDSGQQLRAHLQLAALSEATQFVLLRHADQDYTFTRAQAQRLQGFFQEREESRQRADQEARDLAIFNGSESLDAFLATRIKIADGLPVSHGKLGQVITVYSLQFSGGFHHKKIITIKELAQLIASREDFDGIEFNPPYSGDPKIHFGPNFAIDCLASVDPRLAACCPAAPAREFYFGLYLTRFFALMEDYARKVVAQQLNQAQTLRTAIAPGEHRLTRAKVRSIVGARVLREQPNYFEREWLDRFIARLERALKTRWRVGLF